MYIGSCAGYCYAIDKFSGKEIWNYDVGEVSFHGDPVITDSTIIFATDGKPGSIYSFSLKDGDLLWNYSFPESDHRIIGISTNLIRQDSILFGVNTLDELIALDVYTGDLKWKYKSSLIPEGRYWNIGPSISDSVIYFIGYDGWLYCIDAKNGNELWKSEIGARPSTSLSLGDNHIFIGCADSSLYKLSCKDGRVVKSIKLDGRPGLQINFIDSSLYLLTQDDPELSGMINLICINGENLDMRWHLEASYDSPWSIKRVYGYRDFVIAGKSDGEVLLLNPNSGRVKLSFNIEGEVKSVKVEKDVLYIGTITGMIHAVRILR